MIFNFTFTFPEVDNLNDIIVSGDELSIVDNIYILQGPVFPKPSEGADRFLGWEIYQVKGDLELLSVNDILTKNNILNFDVNNLSLNQITYSTILYCRMKWAPQLGFNLVWDDFDEVVENTNLNSRLLTSDNLALVDIDGLLITIREDK